MAKPGTLRSCARAGIAAVGQGGAAPQPDRAARARRAALPRHRRLRGDRHPADRERDPLRPGHHLPGRARPGQDPHRAPAGRPARRGDARARRLRDQRRPARADLPARAAHRSPSRATTTPIDVDRRATAATARSSPRPDITIADLIGEVDPIKVAEGRYLSDELTIHYGLLPRTNRGIFAINELPDLAERIQVGLLNIMEERDVQIRGYKVRLPLDLFVVASANPEDYTNRGRIITPLKDRFGSQIRTHYPRTIEHEIDIMEQERTALRRRRLRDRSCPEYMKRDRRRDHPPGPRAAPTSPSARASRVRVIDRQLREPARRNALKRAIRLRRAAGGAARQRPRRARRLDRRQDRAGDGGRRRARRRSLEKLVQRAVLNVFNRTLRRRRAATSWCGAFENGLNDRGRATACRRWSTCAQVGRGAAAAARRSRKLGAPGNPAQRRRRRSSSCSKGLHLSRKLNKDRRRPAAAYRARRAATRSEAAC